MAARTDPFNYILEMEMSICLKQQLGETFWMEEVLQCKGKQKRGRQFLLAKLSSTKTLFIINTICVQGVNGPSRWGGHEVPAPASSMKRTKN